jgi:hypothetical protein
MSFNMQAENGVVIVSRPCKHIQEAIAELNEAEKWAREHHEIK